MKNLVQIVFFIADKLIPFLTGFTHKIIDFSAAFMESASAFSTIRVLATLTAGPLALNTTLRPLLKTTLSNLTSLFLPGLYLVLDMIAADHVKKLQNSERAYIAASRRTGRPLQERFKSAHGASLKVVLAFDFVILIIAFRKNWKVASSY
ncbi:hypothetical protein NEOLI_004921 [Neolecta irregularis DAH-3]|uniref:Uncharacterized protein n=1 Tax=Neolecta irregularis (strain DAH-3) TaxID=1198029 RepID=A0A1U7LGU8_NEOID|nr:hypothetical protein NEOLI_004921 [Neolecta irregularis DAH-3]|eukprot:OLL21751.1 hypothetical protein NEOLI_004921 [Neolecta irregularis DAH-3]